jgi:hypothetical protein
MVAKMMGTQAEQAVIGSVLLDSSQLALLDNLVSASDFSAGQLEAVWQCMQAMRTRQEPIDVITVGGALKDLDIRGLTAADLHIMVGDTPHALSSRSYAAQVRKDAVRRQLRMVSSVLSQSVESGEPSQILAQTVNALRDIQSENIATQLVASRLDEILAGTDVYEWVIPNLLEKRDRLIITGGEGAGKSTLVRQISILASAGIHPLDFGIIEPVRVLVIDSENSEAQWRRAARGMAEQARLRGAQNPGSMRLACSARLDMTSDKDLGQVHRLIDEHEPQLVVIGPLYRLTPRAINSDDEAAPLLAALDTIRDRGISLTIEAHAGHALGLGGERDLRPRGSAALMGWPEMGIGLRPILSEPDRVKVVRWRGDRDRRNLPDKLERGGSWPWQPAL